MSAFKNKIIRSGKLDGINSLKSLRPSDMFVVEIANDPSKRFKNVYEFVLSCCETDSKQQINF